MQECETKWLEEMERGRVNPQVERQRKRHFTV